MSITIPTFSYGFVELTDFIVNSTWFHHHVSVNQINSIAVAANPDPTVRIDASEGSYYLPYTGTPTTSDAEDAFQEVLDGLDLRGRQRWLVGETALDGAGELGALPLEKVLRVLVVDPADSRLPQIVVIGASAGFSLVLPTTYSTVADAQAAIPGVLRQVK